MSLIKLAWRNCWRSKGRTLVVVCSIIVGVWASLLLMGFMDGLMASRQETGVDRYYSHLQIENKSYAYDQSLTNYLPVTSDIEDVLHQDKNIIAYSGRCLLDVSLATARNQQGGRLIGVDEEKDKSVVAISDKIISGAFFGDEYKRPIVIGEKLADKMKVKLGSNLMIQFVNLDTVQVYKNFKVAGIFKSGDAGVDEGTVFVPNKAIQKLIRIPLLHRFLVKTSDLEHLVLMQQSLQKKMPEGVVVKTWRESAVALAYVYHNDSYRSSAFIRYC